mmetsp:Transcript_14507/g.31222  ORF Transcript_14507/g.31222 Transcript_14507/m.31222 type:complete len:285 (+) Transcript_14507:164-1018(+)
MYHIMTRYQVHVILRNSIQHRVPWRPILPAKAWYYTLLLRIVFVPLPTLGGHTQTIHRLRHHLPLRQYLNQIPIRILHERQPLHPTGIRRLEKLRAHLVKSLARPVHVRDRDANVSESAANLLPVLRSRGIGIAGIVNFIGLFFLGAVVPREFDASGRGHAVIPSAGFGGLDGGGGDGSDEVDVEFPLRELRIVKQLKPQHIAIEIQTLLGILNAEHGLLHDEIFGAFRGRTGHVGRDVECSFGCHFELCFRWYAVVAIVGAMDVCRGGGDECGDGSGEKWECE